MENILHIDFPNGVEVFIYADDVCIVSTGNTGPNQRSKMQRALNLIQEKCIELGLKVNSNKTKAMAVKYSKNKLPTELTLQGNPIEWVEHFTYLGVIISHELSEKKQVTHLKQVTKSRTNALKRISSLRQGATYHL